MGFFLDVANLWFTGALGLLLVLVVLEFAGGGLSHWLDSLFPDLHVDAAEGDVDDLAWPSQFLSWLRAGRVPLLMLFVVFLAVFGCGGLMLQHVARQMTGAMLPGWIAALLMLPVSIFPVRFATGFLARVIPRDETAVLSRDAFVGRIAIIVTGNARRGFPAQAKFRDEFRTTHYLLVEPEAEGVELKQGEEVAVMARHRAVYTVIPARDLPAQTQS